MAIPTRTARRWRARRIIESTELVVEHDERRNEPVVRDPSKLMDAAHEDSPEQSSDGEMSEGEGSMAYGNSSNDDSEEDPVVRDEGMIDSEANRIHHVLPLSLTGYSTEELITILLALATKLRRGFSYSATEDILLLAQVLTDARVTHRSKYDWQKISNSLCDCMSIHHFCDKSHVYVGSEVGDSVVENNLLACSMCDQVVDMSNN
nr:PREDICTED: uncharacterized protein LOC105272116 [Fopius arisanus]